MILGRKKILEYVLQDAGELLYINNLPDISCLLFRQQLPSSQEGTSHSKIFTMSGSQ